MSRARLIGLSTAAGALVLMAALFHPPTLPWSSTLHVSLEAGSFGQLNRDAGVELGGVRVGSVQGLDVRSGHALIRLSVDPRYAGQLHADAGATIRPHGLLGPKFVDLDGGTLGRLGEGATIPISRVHVTTDVDQVLDALQPDVRHGLQTVLVELGTASDGRGEDVNAALASLGAASDDLAQVTSVLHRRDGDLAQTIVASEQLNRDVQQAPLDAQIRDTNTVLTGLVQVDNQIGSGIDHTAILLQQLDVVMDGNSGNLSRTLDHAPGTVTRLRAVLVEGTALVEGINPSLPSLMTAVVETKSAFGGADANGHFVRIQAITGACTLGLSAGCGSPQTSQAPASAAQPPGSVSTQQTAAGQAQPVSSAATLPRSRASDQDLLRLFLGG